MSRGGRVVGPRVHGLLDYATVVVFLAAPSVFGFTGLPAGTCYALAVAHLLLTMLTDFPAGVRGVIPFRLHRAVEFAVALVLVVGPWILAESVPLAGRIFFGAMGVAILAVAMGTGRKERRERETEEAAPAGE